MKPADEPVVTMMRSGATSQPSASRTDAKRLGVIDARAAERRARGGNRGRRRRLGRLADLKMNDLTA
jgi:hypothetical protein